jgi:hypothetical protein
MPSWCLQNVLSLEFAEHFFLSCYKTAIEIIPQQTLYSVSCATRSANNQTLTGRNFAPRYNHRANTHESYFQGERSYQIICQYQVTSNRACTFPQRTCPTVIIDFVPGLGIVHGPSCQASEHICSLYWYYIACLNCKMTICNYFSYAN